MLPNSVETRSQPKEARKVIVAAVNSSATSGVKTHLLENVSSSCVLLEQVQVAFWDLFTCLSGQCYLL